MLNTQVAYWTLQETKRHNYATEGLQGEANAIQREQVNVNWFTAKEAQRHNKEQESIGWTNANENIRHNKVTENLGFATLAETKRHNIQQEGIGWKNASANVQQAQAATRRAMADYGRYQLEIEQQPYKIEVLQSQDVANEAKSARDLADARYGGVDRMIGFGNMVGNLLGGAGRVLSNAKPGNVTKKVVRIVD